MMPIGSPRDGNKIYVAVDFHDHQPIYRPGTDPADTPEIQQFVLGSGDADNRREVYKDAEAYAVEAQNGSLPHFGIQVSYTGSLMENLQKTAARGLWPGNDWSNRYYRLRQSASTSLGNPRLDFVNIGYNHPLMGLLATGAVNSDKDIALQIQMHQVAVDRLFGGPTSKGFFPPEMAFSERMIPALRSVGIDWVLVDNAHVDRANQDYDNRGDGLPPPNAADRKNPPQQYETLPNDLAKTSRVSVEALRPHYAEYVDPATGDSRRIVVVPEERSLSSSIQKDRDGSKLDEIINKFQKYNTDPQHPILVVYATDGDNNGSNSGEFHRNVPLDLATRFPNQVVLTTVSDYLAMFPTDKTDKVHVEDGSWWGANLGDPQFSKWIDDPAYTGFSPKNNSWAVLTAAKNAVLTADQMEPAGTTRDSVAHIVDDTGSDTEKAWHDLLVGQTSCYEYWGPDNVLSYSSVRAANTAVESARKVIGRHPQADRVGPTIFLPRRYPYNPTSNIGVATYAFDVSGVRSVKLKYRTDTAATYDGKPWNEVPMDPAPSPDPAVKPPVWVEPTARADVYRGTIPTQAKGALVQYYVEAEDSLGNVSRSPIQTVSQG